jgi:hypothetical protein
VSPGTGGVPAMTTNTPTSAETVGALQHRFPGALVWQGRATGHWWAYVPVGGHGRLVEAEYPAEMAYRLAGAWRAHQGLPPDHGRAPSRATALARITSGLVKPNTLGGGL